MRSHGKITLIRHIAVYCTSHLKLQKKTFLSPNLARSVYKRLGRFSVPVRHCPPQVIARALSVVLGGDISSRVCDTALHIIHVLLQLGLVAATDERGSAQRDDGHPQEQTGDRAPRTRGGKDGVSGGGGGGGSGGESSPVQGEKVGEGGAHTPPLLCCGLSITLDDVSLFVYMLVRESSQHLFHVLVFVWARFLICALFNPGVNLPDPCCRKFHIEL